MAVLAETHISAEMRPAIAVERKIGRHHIAFFRTILLGMGMDEMSDRCLETGMDLRRAKAILVWIQDTLRQAALSRGKRHDAHLFRIRIAASSGKTRAHQSRLLISTEQNSILTGPFWKKNSFNLTWLRTASGQYQTQEKVTADRQAGGSNNVD
jgi:hypothetical protein